MGEGHTPPLGSVQANAQRHGVKINELVGGAGQKQDAQQHGQAGGKSGERTSHDTSMVQALRRGPT